MNLPNKSVSYEESVISKFPLVLRAIPSGGISPLDLYNAVQDSLLDIAEFTEVLDCLFVLGKIKLDTEKGLLCHAN